MGMRGYLSRVPIGEISEIKANPDRVVELLVGKVEKKEVPSRFWWRRWLGRKDVIYEILEEDAKIPAEQTFEFDKAWAGLHFILTGTDFEGDFPENFISRGGTFIRDHHVGWGQARMFEPIEVVQIKRMIANVALEDVKARFDPQKMMDLCIYPGIWQQENQKALAYLSEVFVDLKEFILATDEEKFGFLMHIE